MLAFAKLWTWIGNLFIPLAIGWAVYVRGGLTDKPPSTGVLVSRSYWGLLVTLIVGATLIWTLALYVQLAKRKQALILVPPNTTFEDDTARSRIISWGTVVAFALAITISLVLFGVRYGESQIHSWDDPQPLQNSFWSSRWKAYEIGCSKQPCFAVDQRMEAANTPIFGVNEYILYLTDGGPALVALLAIAGFMFLLHVILHKPPRILYEL